MGTKKKRMSDLEKAVDARSKQIAKRIESIQKRMKNDPSSITGKDMRRLFDSKDDLQNVESEVLDKRLKRRTAPAGSGAGINRKQAIASDVISRNANYKISPSETFKPSGRTLRQIDESKFTPVFIDNTGYTEYSNGEARRVEPRGVRRGYERPVNAREKMSFLDDATGKRVTPPTRTYREILGSRDLTDNDISRMDRLIALKEKKGKSIFDAAEDYGYDDYGNIVDKPRAREYLKERVQHKLNKTLDMDAIREQLAKDYPSGNARPYTPHTSGLSKFLRNLTRINLLSQVSDIVQGKNIDQIIQDQIPLLNEADPLDTGGVDDKVRRMIEDPSSAIGELRRRDEIIGSR